MGNLTANVHPGIIRITPPAYTGSYTVTPDEQGEVLETNGKVMTDDVTINPVPWVKPEGSKNITTNGTHNVEAYSSADVQVPQGVFPTGALNISQNGTFNVMNYESAVVNIDTAPAYGLIVDGYDSSTSNKIVGKATMYGATNIPQSYFYGNSDMTQFELVSNTFYTAVGKCFENCTSLTTVIFPASRKPLGQWMIGDYCFRGCTSLETIIARGNLTITSWFGSTTAVVKQVIVGGEVSFAANPAFGSLLELLDFRGCTSVPALPDASWLTPAGTCTIKCKQSLVNEWQNATNWNAVPNLVWEGDPNAD